MRALAWLSTVAGDARRARRLELGLLAGFAGLHGLLGALLLPQWMFAKYPEGARLLSQDRLAPEAAADFSPLYLLFNLALTPGQLRALQSLAGAAALACVYLLARELLGRLAAAVALALASLSVTLLLYEAVLEPDLWVAVLNTAALTLLVRDRSRLRWGFAAGAGAAMGLSIALRPSALLLLVLAVGWVLATGRSLSHLRWAGALLVAAAVAACAPPLALRAMAQQSLAATMSAGKVLHLGNRPEGTGLGAQPPLFIKLLERQQSRADRPDYVHTVYREVARASVGAPMEPLEVERYWVERMLSFPRREPLAFLALWARKACFYVFGPDGHDISEARRAEVKLFALPLLRGSWLGLLALAGLAVSLLRRAPVGLLAGYVGTTLALALGFYVLSRFRLAALPAWCVLASALVAHARDALRARKVPWVAVACCAAVAVLPHLASFVSDMGRQLERGTVASVAGAQLEAQRAAAAFPEATQTFVAVLAAQPYSVWTRDLRGIPFEEPRVIDAAARRSAQLFGVGSDADAYLLAVLTARAGRCDAALPTFEALGATGFRGAVFDLSLDPWLWVAWCREQQGDAAAALAAAEASLRGRPGTLDGLAVALATAARAGKADERVRSWEQELFELHDPLSARYALSRARNDAGDFAGALVDADAGLALLSGAGVLHYERARALAGLARRAEAVVAYRRALELFPQFAFPTRPLDAAVREELASAPDDAALLALAAEHALRQGRLDEARRLAAQARSRPDGDSVSTLPELERLLGRAAAAPGALPAASY